LRRLYATKRGQPRSQEDQLSTKHPHSLPVVFEVADSVRLPADRFHLVGKAFGDSAAAGEAPHPDDLCRPGVKGVPAEGCFADRLECLKEKGLDMLSATLFVLLMLAMAVLALGQVAPASGLEGMIDSPGQPEALAFFRRAPG